jgi:hypothetical protein
VRLLDFDEELLPPPRRLERKLHRELLLGAQEILKQRPERRGHRNGKRARLTTLRARKSNLVFGQVNAPPREIRVSRSQAPGVQRNLEGSLHPFRLDLQQLPYLSLSVTSGFFTSDDKVILSPTPRLLQQSSRPDGEWLNVPRKCRS